MIKKILCVLMLFIMSSSLAFAWDVKTEAELQQEKTQARFLSEKSAYSDLFPGLTEEGFLSGGQPAFSMSDAEQGLWLYQDHRRQAGYPQAPGHQKTEEGPELITVDLQEFLEVIGNEEDPSDRNMNRPFLTLQYEKSGRPYLEGEGEGDGEIPYISISHSGSFAAVAISDRRIGIDIEHQRKISSAVAKKILTPEEYVSYEIP